MAKRSDFGVLLDVLEDTLGGSTDVLRRRTRPVDPPAERRRAVLDQLRENPDAQLVLFQLAVELTAEATDSPEAVREELVGFAAAVHDRFGVNVLRTAATNRDQLGNLDVPDGLFAEETLDRVEDR